MAARKSKSDQQLDKILGDFEAQPAQISKDDVYELEENRFGAAFGRPFSFGPLTSRKSFSPAPRRLGADGRRGLPVPPAKDAVEV